MSTETINPAPAEAADFHPQTTEEFDPSEQLDAPEARTSRVSATLDRIATFITDRSDALDIRAKQNEAYDSYSENIDATKTRERQETIDHAKDVMRGFGRSALNFLRRGARIAATPAVVGLGAAVMAGDGIRRGAEAAAHKAGEVRDNVTTFVGEKVDAAEKFYTGKKMEIGNKIEFAQLLREQNQELKQFDKQARSEEKAQAKQDKQELRDARQNGRELAKAIKAAEKDRQKAAEAAWEAKLKARLQLQKEKAQAERAAAKAARVQRATDAKVRRAARWESFKSGAKDRYNDVKTGITGSIDYAKGASKEVIEQQVDRARKFGHEVATVVAVAHETGSETLEAIKSARTTAREKLDALHDDEQTIGRK